MTEREQLRQEIYLAIGTTVRSWLHAGDNDVLSDLMLSLIDREKKDAVEQALALAYARHSNEVEDTGPKDFCQPIIDRMFPPNP